MLSTASFSFLKSLKKNNDKAWFDAHRPAYETAKKEVEQFVQSVIDAQSKTDSSIAAIKAKETLFRINRDVRFAKDKSPYKTNFGAFINSDGRKAMTPGYYMHIEPGKSFVGGGLYMPSPADLKAVRQEIEYNLPAFKKIIEAKPFIKIFGGLSNEPEWKLSRVPQGFDKDSPAAPYLQYKSYVAMQFVPDELLTGKKAKSTVVDAFAALHPLLEFLRTNLVKE